MAKEITNDAAAEVLEELEKNLKSLQEICIKNKMPMFVCISTENVLPVKNVIKTLSPTELGTEVEDDRITKYIGSCNKKLALVYVNEGLQRTEADLMDDVLADL